MLLHRGCAPQMGQAGGGGRLRGDLENSGAALVFGQMAFSASVRKSSSRSFFFSGGPSCLGLGFRGLAAIKQTRE